MAALGRTAIPIGCFFIVLGHAVAFVIHTGDSVTRNIVAVSYCLRIPFPGLLEILVNAGADQEAVTDDPFRRSLTVIGRIDIG